MTINPLKLVIYADTTSGFVRRSIAVKPEPDSDEYRVHMVDVISDKTQNHGLLTGEPGEETAQSRLSQDVTGVSKTLEEANAEAKRICEKYVVDGWKEETAGVACQIERIGSQPFQLDVLLRRQCQVHHTPAHLVSMGSDRPYTLPFARLHEWTT